jgi:hypothetical protein
VLDRVPVPPGKIFDPSDGIQPASPGWIAAGFGSEVVGGKMSAIKISSLEQFSAELEKLKELSKSPAIPVAVAQPEPSFAPLTLEQVNAKIEEFSLALEGSLPDPVRAEIERRRAALVREQMRLRVGYIPDENGDRPMDLQAIAATATKSVMETLAAAPASPELQSELELPPDDEEDDEYEEEFDIAEQIEAMNEIDVADAAVVSAEPPATIPAPAVPLQVAMGGFFLQPDICMALRASVAANLPHVKAKITERMVELVLGK